MRISSVLKHFWKEEWQMSERRPRRRAIEKMVWEM